MVRSSVKMESTTTKVLNIYNKSADPSNKTGSLMVTTMVPGSDANGDVDLGEFDASEITVIFEDEIETLYVGPVEISEEEEKQRQLQEAAAAAAAAAKDPFTALKASSGSRKSGSIKDWLKQGASSPASPGAGAATTTTTATEKTTRASARSSTKATTTTTPAVAPPQKSPRLRKSDSGCQNTPQPQSQAKSAKKSPVAQKRTSDTPKTDEMVIKKRGRPPGSGKAAQSPVVSEKTAKPSLVKKSPPTTTQTPVAVVRKPVATVSPKQQFECDLCDEIFMRMETIVDHYQSYHRVDPKKRSIQPRAHIPAPVEPQVPAEEEEQEEEEETPVVDVIPQAAEPDDSEEEYEEEDEEEDSDEEEVAPKKKSSRKTPAKAVVKKEKAPGLICGDCNLTFRTIPLLNRHVQLMHEVKQDEDDDEEEDEEAEDEEEVKVQPSKKPKPNPPSEAPVAKKRGRPRKSEATAADSPTGSSPRILNRGGLGRLKVADESEQDEGLGSDPLLLLNSSGSDSGVNVKTETPARTMREQRKRRPVDFAEDDSENDVVPLNKRGKGRRATDLKLSAKGGEMILVEVIDEKGNKASTKEVYSIQDCSSVDQDGKEKYSCPLCDATFTRKYSLEPHIQRVHHKKRDKECPHCGRKFQAQGDLTRHLAIHTGEKPFPCSVPGCPFAFVSKSDLNKHELRHTAGVPRTYVCGQCEKSFERPYDLRRHQMTHKDLIGQVDFRQYKCEQCDREFTRKDEYKAHVYRHLGVKPLKCHVCGKPFADQSNLAKHCKGHGPLTHDPKQDPLVCTDCGNRFMNTTALGRHMSRCFIDQSAFPVHTVPQIQYFDEDAK